MKQNAEKDALKQRKLMDGLFLYLPFSFWCGAGVASSRFGLVVRASYMSGDPMLKLEVNEAPLYRLGEILLGSFVSPGF